MFPTRAVLLLVILSGCAHASRTQGENAEGASDQGPPRVVTANDIERAPGRPIEEVLMSRFPGVVVTRVDGGIAVRIRGTTSIRGRTEPLYVIDEVPIEPGPGGALFGINPHDIESIEVLTDPAGTTMYGVRGANGVILIKTKQHGH